jgi:gas vesicle protein
VAHAHSISDYPGQIASIVAFSAALGAVTALLVSPRSGADVRRAIRGRARNMKDRSSTSSEGELTVLAPLSDSLKKTSRTLKRETTQTAKAVKENTKK